MEFNKKYFEEIYGKKYLERNPKRKIVFYLRKVLQYQKQGKLLDVGCAYGLFCKLASEHFSCSGCDISNHAIHKAEGMTSSDDGVMLFVSNINDIPEEEKYDVITCFDVLEHVQDLTSAFSKLKRLMRDTSSILVLSVPVYDGIFGKVVERLDNDPTHVHKESRSFWIDSISKHYFEIVELTGLFRYFLFNKFYVHFGRNSFWRFSPAILIIARNIDRA